MTYIWRRVLMASVGFGMRPRPDRGAHALDDVPLDPRPACNIAPGHPLARGRFARIGEELNPRPDPSGDVHAA